MASRRTPNTSLARDKKTAEHQALGTSDLRNIAAPVSAQSEVVTLRLSGAWYTIWTQLKAELPGISDAEILRQSVALRIAVLAKDSKGLKPDVKISYHDQGGRLITTDLEEHIGIKKT